MTSIATGQQPVVYRPGKSSGAALTLGAGLLALASGLLGALGSAPIYRDGWAWVVALVAAGLGYVIVWAGRRFDWGPLTAVALIGAFLLSVVPLAVPSAWAGGPSGVLAGLGDGLAAVALGWKQLLTLTLPVGSYQTVLVPLLVVVLLTSAAASWLALRGGRSAEFASLPLVLPVAFGTVFGASSVSDPLRLGPLTLHAPRELALWAGAFALIALWIAWSSGIARRAALRRGRAGLAVAPVRRHGAVRGLAGAGILIAALVIGAAVAPAVAGEARSVPRDRIDPELVIAERSSPLAGYRVWKRDAEFSSQLFTVDSDGGLPGRMRLAVMDRFDGVDFSVGTGAGSARFTRFPSGQEAEQTSNVEVRVEEGYSDIWVPVSAPLASPPVFSGPRAGKLADSFYLNRETGGAVAVPTKRGLAEGDAFSAEMSVAADAEIGGQPARPESIIDLEAMPQLEKWWHAQELPATGEGLTEAIDRLRERGYLSHSLTDARGERLWLEQLGESYGTRFVTSPGGHSIARVEQLFQQLNDQQKAAGPRADDEMLVAGIGDDEQFAAAAALLAQSLGYDARVVLGVRLGGEDAGVPGVPACDGTCTGENIAAWVEARGSDGVWAPFDVTPQVETPPTTLEEGEQLPEYPTVPDERDAREADPPVGTSDSDGRDAEDEDEDPLAALWLILKNVGLGLAALALLAALVLFIPIAKRLRRRRRRNAPAPEIRALGAWDELVDLHCDAGARIDRGRARREIASEAGVPDGDWIASEVDRAVFSREGIDGAAADALWGRVGEAIAAKRASLGPWRRIRAEFSLASYGVGMPARLRGAGTRIRSSAIASGVTARLGWGTEASRREAGKSRVKR